MRGCTGLKTRVIISDILSALYENLSEIGILAYFAKICTRENDQPCGMYVLEQLIHGKSDNKLTFVLGVSGPVFSFSIIG